MEISSQAFKDGERIPVQYTCDGENTNPPLEITAVPAEAKSLVLIVDDVDAPGGVFDHWIVFDIPVSVRMIQANEEWGIEGTNSFGKARYGGPCPHQGEHRYYFRIYALDTLLGLSAGINRTKVEAGMKGHILALRELMGKYSRE